MQTTDFYGNPILQDETGVYSVLSDGVKDYTNKPDPTMPSTQGRKMYEQKIAEMQQEPEKIAGAKSDSSKASSGVSSGAMGAGQTLVQGGNVLDATSSGLMMSGNPKAMAAGLALQTLNQVSKQKQQNEQNKYVAEVQRVKARQDAIDRLASIGQNLKA